MFDLITFDPEDCYFSPLPLCTFDEWLHSIMRLMKVVIFGDCAWIRSLVAASQTRLRHNADRWSVNLIPVTIQGIVVTPEFVAIVTNQGKPHR